jgi:hypothetical protein
MKKVLMIMVACFLTAGAFAQSKMNEAKMNKTESDTKEVVVMKEGRMMVMKGQNTTELKENMTLKNGTVVMTDGKVKTKDGKMVPLKEGEWVDMKGAVNKMKTNEKMKSKM